MAENLLVYRISYKSLIVAKLLCIRLDKIDRFIRTYDKTRFLALFGTEKYDYTYSRIR